MKNTHIHEPSLDELAAKAVRLGRELEGMAHAVYLGGNTRDFGFVSRTLRRLAERNTFDPRDGQSLGALRSILDADLASEVTVSYDEFKDRRAPSALDKCGSVSVVIARQI